MLFFVQRVERKNFFAAFFIDSLLLRRRSRAGVCFVEGRFQLFYLFFFERQGDKVVFVVLGVLQDFYRFGRGDQETGVCIGIALLMVGVSCLQGFFLEVSFIIICAVRRRGEVGALFRSLEYIQFRVLYVQFWVLVYTLLEGFSQRAFIRELQRMVKLRFGRYRSFQIGWQSQKFKFDSEEKSREEFFRIWCGKFYRGVWREFFQILWNSRCL